MYFNKGDTMRKKDLKKTLSDQTGEINMIAIVLILIVVIMLAIIFRESMQGLLNTIFERITNDISNF